MAASTDRRTFIPSGSTGAPKRIRALRRSSAGAGGVTTSVPAELAGSRGVSGPAARQQGPKVDVHAATIAGLQERRRRRRAKVLPMYSSAIVRVLSRRDAPIEGYVLDVSETGMAVEIDSPVAVGQAVTVEFRIAGLGRVKEEEWMEFAVAAEVVRQDNQDDFPAGPYKVGLRFVQIPTMMQAQIARFVATHA